MDRAVVFLARSSLWVKSERSRKRPRLCSFLFFQYQSQFRYLRARSREKKRVELNQTALLVTFTPTFGWTSQWRAPSMSGVFFLRTILQKGSERCVLIDFDVQNYPSPVLWRWFPMYPGVSKFVSTTRNCAMVIVKTFLREDVVENIAEAVAW